MELPLSWSFGAHSRCHRYQQITHITQWTEGLWNRPAHSWNRITSSNLNFIRKQVALNLRNIFLDHREWASWTLRCCTTDWSKKKHPCHSTKKRKTTSAVCSNESVLNHQNECAHGNSKSYDAKVVMSSWLNHAVLRVIADRHKVSLTTTLTIVLVLI